MTTLDLPRYRAQTADPPGARRWLMLAVLLTGQFMALLDAFVVNVAMPSIGAGLHASGAQLQLVIGGYSAAYAMLLITGARLGDLYGRRRMYLLGVSVFTAASLACGLAPNGVVLIADRFVQGAAAAVLVPQIMSVIQMSFSGAARAKAVSAFGIVLSTGAAAGVILGGTLVNANLLGATWRPVFLVNVPLGIALTVLVPRLVPADEPRGTRHLDLRGLVIGALAVCLVVLPLVLGRDLGWPPWVLACIGAGLVLGGAFVVTERRIAARGGDPLFDLSVLRAPGLAPGMLTLVCAGATYGAILFVFTVHVQAGLGESALRAGLSFLPMAGMFGLVSYFWRALPGRVHPALAPAGLVLCALAFLGMAGSLRGGGTGGVLLWLSLGLLGTGLGACIPPLVTQSLVGVPRSQAADASGLVTTTMQLGQVVGVAGFGTVFLALAHRHTHDLSVAQVSGAAVATTGRLLALGAAAGLLAAVALARAVAAARA